MDDNPVSQLAAAAGFNVVKRTVWIAPSNNAWDNPTNNPGVTPLPKKYRDAITGDMQEAQANHVRVIIELYPVIKYGPPRRPAQMRGMCDVAKDIVGLWPDTVIGVEVGVEPNSYTFWKPQFNPDGTQASAAAYERWLAICYDTIKPSHPDTLVIGGSLSSRGEDDPHKPTSGTSPTLFIQKFCEVLSTTGRTVPVMDILDMHTYPDPEDQDPAVTHPDPSTTITIADSAKLDKLLGCFSQLGLPKPPYIWGEGGYNTAIPSAQKDRYTGEKPSSVRVIDEATQGRYLAEEIQMAYCQPHSMGFINFHMVDDADLARSWQSGLAYAPGNKRHTSGASVSYTLKQSYSGTRKALASALAGTIQCG
jgi:hypothetical protein